jgi:hypothetical protein
MRFGLGLAALLLAWAAPAAAAERVEVTVARAGERWTADYLFPRRERAWVFPRSALTRVGERPWRPQSWRIETPGVRLERRGHYDVLVAADGERLPSRVRIAFRPFADDLIASYDNALVFTDGSVALYSKQFVAFPLESAAAAERLPRDLNGVPVPRVDIRISFRDAAGPVLHAGRRSAILTLRDNAGDGTYVLFGPARPIVTEDMAAILDPQLPAWVRASLARHVPDILARYAAVLGPAPGPRPTIMASWAGPTPGTTSLGGSVLPGLITMAYEGDRLLAETDEARGFGLWFIAHEAAHFWLGNAVTYEFSRDAWITEGGADLLAFRTVAAVDPRYDWRGALNESIADCARLSRGRGVAGAETRNEQRAYYACGAVFGLVAEAASRRPFIQFVRGLIDANRADHVVTRADWLGALDRASQDRSLSRDVAVMLDRGSTDPAAAIASLFSRAGVPFTRGPDGAPRLG